MNPTDIIFQSVSSLTGGLISDMTTAICGLFAITFLLIGVDWLKDIFELAMQKKNTNAALDRAKSYKALADSMDCQVSKDYLNARYRNEIRRAAR